MRRRRLLALAGSGLLAPLAGCSPCGETWTGLGFEVAPTRLDREGDGWLVEATLAVRFAFGREGAGLDGAALAAFDRDGRVAGEAALGDLRWSDVPEARRDSDECGTSGSVERTATVRSGAFPRWVGLRYDGATRSHTEERVIAAYPPGRTPGGSATATEYESRSVRALDASLDETPTRPPVDHLSFDRGDTDCGPTPALDVRVRGSALSITHGRSIPAERYRPALLGHEYDGETLVLDVGLRGRPRLRRLECRRTSYVARVGFSAPGDRPGRVTVRHLDPDGDVGSIHRVEV